MEQVILVNELDEALGAMEKMEAHKKALLHRALSVFIFNSKGEMLLQQRAAKKYHSAGLWTNACCTHPRPGEDVLSAAERRLKEELGFETTLHKVFDFIYKAAFANGLTEYEFDHVFTGTFHGTIIPNPEEVENYTYASMSSIQLDIQNNPQKYTEWFLIAFPEIMKWWNEHFQNNDHL
ncbi:MAG: isopentenyl-diphosphate Delta-isomerase [Panacibacter sp.]